METCLVHQHFAVCVSGILRPRSHTTDIKIKSAIYTINLVFSPLSLESHKCFAVPAWRPQPWDASIPCHQLWREPTVAGLLTLGSAGFHWLARMNPSQNPCQYQYLCQTSWKKISHSLPVSCPPLSATQLGAFLQCAFSMGLSSCSVWTVLKTRRKCRV